jgi:hypothetical protein
MLTHKTWKQVLDLEYKLGKICGGLHDMTDKADPAVEAAVAVVESLEAIELVGIGCYQDRVQCAIRGVIDPLLEDKDRRIAELEEENTSFRHCFSRIKAYHPGPGGIRQMIDETLFGRQDKITEGE